MTFKLHLLCVLSSILSIYAYGQNEYDVIIMGAGASGIAAAKTLYEAGVTNILIIEAQWYIGGRTVVHYFADYMLNIGASWIDGACFNRTDAECSNYTQINPMLEAANKYNFSFVLSRLEQEIIFDFGGNEHDETDFYDRMNTFWEAQECVKTVTPKDMSYFAGLNLCGWKTPLDAVDKTVQWYNKEWNAQHAKWCTASADIPYVLTYETYGPDTLFITDPRGYQGIIKALASEFLVIDNIDDEEKIILNSPITAIQYDENGVKVTLENTTEYSAEYGIVTFPLGVLQSDIVEFIPTLPSWKIDSFLAFDFIDATPIFIKWPYRWWNDTNITNSEWIILIDDRFGYFPAIYNLDHPNLYNGSLIWRIDVTLDLARMVAVQSIDDTIKQIVDLKLSHYFDNIPNPDNVFVAPWHSNPYIQGAYSNWPPGFSEDDKKAMGSLLSDRLFFAGEALSNLDYGYVHAAWVSGNNTANQMLSCMGYDNGFDCPSEYVPPSDDCKTVDDSIDLLWLWIILGIVFGIILGYLLSKYANKSVTNKGNVDYGSVDNMAVPMVTQTTDQS